MIVRDSNQAAEIISDTTDRYRVHGTTPMSASGFPVYTLFVEIEDTVEKETKLISVSVFSEIVERQKNK